jgi:hypothetical protein
MFSLATWDFLLSTPFNDFFKMRLTNEAMNKREDDLGDKFHDLGDTFIRFMSHKKKILKQVGEIQLCDYDRPSMAFVMNQAM